MIAMVATKYLAWEKEILQSTDIVFGLLSTCRSRLIMMIAGFLRLAPFAIDC